MPLSFLTATMYDQDPHPLVHPNAAAASVTACFGNIAHPVRTTQTPVEKSPTSHYPLLHIYPRRASVRLTAAPYDERCDGAARLTCQNATMERALSSSNSSCECGPDLSCDNLSQKLTAMGSLTHPSQVRLCAADSKSPRQFLGHALASTKTVSKNSIIDALSVLAFSLEHWSLRLTRDNRACFSPARHCNRLYLAAISSYSWLTY